MAINSARHTTEVNIGFSIPIYQIIDTVNQWVNSPLTENDIISLFYNQDGVYYYQDYMDGYEYGYFEDGTYNDEYMEYYEIPYEESWYHYWDYWSDDYDGGTGTDEHFSEDYSSNDYYYNEYDNYDVYGETERSNDYENQESEGTEESNDVDNNGSMDVEKTPEIWEETIINEESESIQEGNEDFNAECFPVEEKVKSVE